MEKLTVIVADSSREYVEMLLRFVRNSEFAGSLSVKAFSEKTAFYAYLGAHPAPHIVLMEPVFLSEDAPPIAAGLVILLLPSHYAKEEEQLPSLFKYQPLNQLLGAMKTMYLEKHSVVVERMKSSGSAKFIACYSIVGSCGKTTAAINLGRQLSLQGNKVLYVNLETVSSSPVWFGTMENQEMSEILYYVQTNPKQAAARIGQYVKKDASTGLEYLEPLTHLQDIHDMRKPEVTELLDTISQSFAFDYVIVDVDAGFQERTLAILAYCHAVLLLLLDDVQCVYKSLVGLAELQRFDEQGHADLQAKMFVVVNKYTGTFANVEQADALNVQGFLPYIPLWKNVSQGQQLASSPEFNQQLASLASQLFGRELR
ncbi:AAA family ATPase [Paenibacillus athensensis]|uniref:AAA domain-containing protein n=1 Tax=Paenibacillus athensensis TaxID=1967502 RepID=A0A4Y8Q8G2_9BACL|nr:AAA family ATPase [Paenibacillus athensensis]MCD1260375.1 AAA family ATPase [Paenibacillus athensensis]